MTHAGSTTLFGLRAGNWWRWQHFADRVLQMTRETRLRLAETAEKNEQETKPRFLRLLTKLPTLPDGDLTAQLRLTEDFTGPSPTPSLLHRPTARPGTDH